MKKYLKYFIKSLLCLYRINDLCIMNASKLSILLIYCMLDISLNPAMAKKFDFLARTAF